MIRQQACTDVEKVIGGNRHENVDVHVQRLDSYIKTHVDVLKIDIEGFEEGAMRGGSKAWELAAVGAPVCLATITIYFITYIYLFFFSRRIIIWFYMGKNNSSIWHIYAQWLNWTLTFFTSQHVTLYLRTLSLTSATQTKWRSVGTALCIGKSLRGLTDAGLILASSGTRFTPPPPI